MSYATPFDVIQLLERRKIHFRVDSFQSDRIMITVSVPGQLWEIQFHPDDVPDIEIFVSTGPVEAIETLDELRSICEPWADKE